MIIPFVAHLVDTKKKKSDMADFYEISAEDYCRKQKEIEKHHKIIDAADLVKILMDLNFYPGIVQMAIESCPALDLFEEEKK